MRARAEAEGEKAEQSEESFLPVTTIALQHQEMAVFVLEQEQGKSRIVFSRSNL